PPAADEPALITTTKHRSGDSGCGSLAGRRRTIEMRPSALGSDDVSHGRGQGSGQAEHHAVMPCREAGDRSLPLLKGAGLGIGWVQRAGKDNGFFSGITDRAPWQHKYPAASRQLEPPGPIDNGDAFVSIPMIQEGNERGAFTRSRSNLQSERSEVAA